jgi:hypothetical protein
MRKKVITHSMAWTTHQWLHVYVDAAHVYVFSLFPSLSLKFGKVGSTKSMRDRATKL